MCYSIIYIFFSTFIFTLYYYIVLTSELWCSMARLDRVKNLSGLAEWFAGNQRLRKLVNLVIVGKYIQPLMRPLLIKTLDCSHQPSYLAAACTPRCVLLPA